MLRKHCIIIAAVCSCAIIGYEVFSRRSEISHIINSQSEKIFGRSLQENILHSQKIRIQSDDIDMAVDESLDSTIESRYLKKRIRSHSSMTYGALNCPLEMSSFSNFNRAINDYTGTFLTTAMESMQYSNDHKATERVRSVEKSGSLRGRKIVFLGDSLTRHLFIAMGCLSGVTANRVAWAPWVAKHPNDRESGGFSGYNAGRAMISGGADLIYYHIVRNLLTPPGYITPVINNIFERYSWINSCRRREPFYIQPSIISFGEGEIKLSKKDVVVLNAGIYQGTRGPIVKMMKDLLDCVEDAKKKGTAHEDWPQFFYFITPQTSQTSLSSPYANKCVDSKGASGLEKEDRRTFPNLVHSLLGEDMNWHTLARYHVGYGDCIHYTQMGVHDVVAAELAERIQGLDSDSSLAPVSSPSTATPVKSPSEKTKKPRSSNSNGSSCGSKGYCKGLEKNECEKCHRCYWNKEKGSCKRIKKSMNRIY